MLLGQVSYKATEFVSVFAKEVLAQFGPVNLLIALAITWAVLTTIFWTAMRVGGPGIWMHLIRSIALAGLILGLLGATLFVEVAVHFFAAEQPDRKANLSLLSVGFRLMAGVISLILILLAIRGEGWRRPLGWVTAAAGMVLLFSVAGILFRGPLERLRMAKEAWDSPDRTAPWEPDWLRSEDAIWFYQVRLARTVRDEAANWQQQLTADHQQLMAFRQSLDTQNAAQVTEYNQRAGAYGASLKAYQERLAKSSEILELDASLEEKFAFAEPGPDPLEVPESESSIR